MAQTVKVAISLPNELLQQCDRVARELGETRSGLFQAAVRSMIEKLEQEQSLAAAKEIYDQLADSELKLNEAFLSIAAETVLYRAKGDEDE